MKKRLFVAIIIFAIALSGKTQTTQPLEYFLPKNIQYSPKVPVPASIIGHQVGEWHVTHDKLVAYMNAIANANPQRVKLEVTGTTYEGRQQLLLVITSPQNHARIEEIRKQHLDLGNPEISNRLDIKNMPAVLLLGHSVHGNEPSGGNASLLSAYHLAAAEGAEIEALLQNVVVLLDPCFNPDGFQRFSTWANQHKSKNLVSDPNSREFSEVWPGGRFNHYWFDLNRDWLPAVHVESQNRLKYFHDWRPNVLTDHHEMGTNATFFFQPGVPSRVNPLTPSKNQELTGKIAAYHAKYLDEIGSLYYTKEGYDDFYYGKGSTFPDIHGAVGILFEQASSRGHLQESANGLLSFPFTIRNQFYTALSTMEAVKSLREELLEFQRESFSSALTEGRQASFKGYVFGGGHSDYHAEALATMLKRHKVDVRKLQSDLTEGGVSFQASNSYFVPVAQPQFRLIKTVFDKVTNFKDSLFYDVSAWTMPLAYGVSYAALNKVPDTTPFIQKDEIKGSLDTITNAYAWLMDWREFEAPKALYQLLSHKAVVRVATKPFKQSVNGQSVEFPAGTLIVPTQLQSLSRHELKSLLIKIAQQNKVVITPITSGLSLGGIDMGSGKAPAVVLPNIAMLVGTGVNPTDAGEVWHLLDQRLNIPSSHLEITTFNRADASRYNTLVMVGGSYTGLNKEKLKLWVEAGGNLIACEEAVQWCAENGISKVKFKNIPAAIDSTRMLYYADREEVIGAQRMAGAIFRANMDTTHPLCFGYENNFVDLFKSNNVFVTTPQNPYSAPVRYSANPLQSGYITRQNLEAVKGSASVLVQALGRGRVIHLADNPNFRAFWLGSMRLFVNSIFFGSLIDAASARAED